VNTAELKQEASRWLERGHRAVLVQLRAVKGSTPRAAGTRMVVGCDSVLGTIGGGHLEWKAQATAQRLLDGSIDWPAPERIALGPTLGQCCGGSVELVFEALCEASIAAWKLPPMRFHLCLYGAGHVGQALVRLLHDLDVSIDWLDSREGAFLGLHSRPRLGLRTWVSDDLAADAVRSPPGAHHLVMTHHHGLDFEVVLKLLSRHDTGLVGLIGSKTKRAQFEHRLIERGIEATRVADLVCPIGAPGIEGKEPAVVAVAVAAQLLSLPATQQSQGCRLGSPRS